MRTTRNGINSVRVCMASRTVRRPSEVPPLVEGATFPGLERARVARLRRSSRGSRSRSRRSAVVSRCGCCRQTPSRTRSRSGGLAAVRRTRVGSRGGREDGGAGVGRRQRHARGSEVRDGAAGEGVVCESLRTIVDLRCLSAMGALQRRRDMLTSGS